MTKYRHDHVVRAVNHDPREAYQHKRRNGVVLASLASIHAQCLRVKERQHTALQLHGRLNVVFLRATSSHDKHRAILNDPRCVATFTTLVDEFHLALKRHMKYHTNIVRRVLHHRLFSLQLRSIHHQLSAFLRDAGADEGFPLEWRPAFETALGQDEQLLHERLGTVVTTSFLSHEYLKLTTHEQMEVLLNVRSERQQTTDMSRVLSDCLKLIYRSLVKLFGWDLTEKARLVPRWFVPLSAIDFSTSRDLLTKCKATYRGEIALVERGGLKRHLITIKLFNTTAHPDLHVDEKAQIIETFLNKYAAINHSHVLTVRGANFAAGLPFVIRDYATRGTLGGHLMRLRHNMGRKDQVDDTLVWRLLVEACEGLLYIHEQGYATHGGLRGSNLLVNHRGQACIADAGIRVLRDRIGSPATVDEDEYVRWLAPELFDTSGGKLPVQTSMAGDIYAFGMCILEILSGERPWQGLSGSTVEAMKRENDTLLPPQPTLVGDREWRLIQKVCAADPATRLPLSQVRTALLELANGTEGDVVPRSIRIDATTVPTPQEENEFETESVSSYKTTVELDENVDYGTPMQEPLEADSLTIEVADNEADDIFLDSRTGSYHDGEIRPSAVGLALQTNGQMKNAIEYLGDFPDSPPNVLQPHVQLLRAIAKDEASSIHEGGGVRVLLVLFRKHHDAHLRQTILELFAALLSSGHKALADSLVEQGVIALIFEFIEGEGTSKAQQDVCASLLLDLMGQSDQAKRQIGDPDKKYVALLESNENIHHRVLTEIKSVLARFKQAEGNEMLKEGFLAYAIQRFTEAIQLDRRRGIYYADRSLAFCHARRYDEAVEDAQRCMRYNPFDAQGYLRYGIAMKHLKKYTEALAALRKGYQVSPNHPQLTAVMDEVQQLYNQQKAR